MFLVVGVDESMHVDQLFMSFNLTYNLVTVSKEMAFRHWSLLTSQ